MALDTQVQGSPSSSPEARDRLHHSQNLVSQNELTDTALFESAFRYAPSAMALVSPEGRWLRVNYALLDILGYPEDELLATDFQAITHPDDLASDLDYLQELLAGKRETYRVEKRYIHKNGHAIWALLSVSLVRNADGSPLYFVSQILDIHRQKQLQFELESKQRELKIANRKLNKLAMVDSLTETFNRRAFEQKLGEELERSIRVGLPLSILMIDVDRFKPYNDDFGHPAGDEALIKIADVLKEVGRVNDVVARYGGEEFAAILPSTDADGCEIVAERMRSAIAQLDGLKRPITISLGGVTTNPKRDDDSSVPSARELLKLADEALYKAKHSGRNQTHQVVLSD